MKITVFFSLIFLTIILITSCESSKGLLDPTYFFGKFHGITYTDDHGNIIKEDPDDWHYVTESFPPFPPTSFQFFPAYPNPIVVTIITFSYCLSEDSHIVINIESENGIVKNLVNDYKCTGNYSITYNLRDNNNQQLQPGVYRCILEVNGKKYYGDFWFKDEL